MYRQIKKDKAIELMKALDIYKPYIDGFEQSDKVCFYEMFGGYWVEQEPENTKETERTRKAIQLRRICDYARVHGLRRVLGFPARYRLPRRARHALIQAEQRQLHSIRVCMEQD